MQQMTSLMRQMYNGKMYFTGQQIDVDDKDVDDMVAARLALRTRPALGTRPGVPAVKAQDVAVDTPVPVEKTTITGGNSVPAQDEAEKEETKVPVFASDFSKFPKANKGGRSR